ncbi:MAG: hypothetical protein AAF840_03970, partial [Bacteroidota bacterium]
PTQGDYPIIEIRGCGETPQFPEEMTFWIYNDAGNVHRQSGTPLQIQMEVQVQAFAYTTSDDINSMTFQRYKLINRAQEDIFDTYFAMWVDPDLGCFTDDYVGCDTTRSLAYVYNEDELDGATGCTCPQGVNTYCDEIPILGVDYFRGPRAPIFNEDGVQIGEEELGMSSFIYINNGGIGSPPQQTTDPSTAEEYYSYLQGRWRDGSTLWDTGNGFDQVGAGETRFAFPAAPNDPTGWSMVTAELPFGDRRTLQASGPFTLRPGAVNELIIGVVWVPDQEYPNPSIQRLQTADDLAQDLFDACFDLLEGPDAPDVDIIELDQEIVMLWSNGRSSNNFEEAYQEQGFGIPPGQDSLYRFEGYRIFQLADSRATLQEIGDAERVREIAQYDIENGVTKLFNWRPPANEDDNPLDPNVPFLVPELMVSGADVGLRHSISITQDAFASGGDTRLINHRRYYFAIIAYAYNNFKDYDPYDLNNPGQPIQYIQSSRNIGSEDAASYQVIPRPILDRSLMADFGDGAEITRIAGEGNNGNFLDISADTRTAMEEAFAAGETVFPEVTYARGAGPIDVFVVNPLDVVDGEFELTFFDENMANDQLDDEVNWMLRCLDADCNSPTILSDRTIDARNEQLIGEFGFAVTLGDVPEPGVENGENENNGAIGASITYADPELDPWLTFLPDDLNLAIPGVPVAFQSQLFNYVNTGTMEDFESIDPEQVYNTFFPGIYPYQLMDHQSRQGGFPFLSPVWVDRNNASAQRFFSMEDLNNVDIVFTSNKDLWSRCPVIETGNEFYEDVLLDGQPARPPGAREQFRVREAPSVTKNAGADGLPEVDTNIDPDLDEGMGWFPGYAVDVETGQRLEIFWGENSLYDGRPIGEGDFTAQSNGNDMIWNPSSVVIEPVPDNNFLLSNIYNYPIGGQHFFYVTNRPYDAGEYLESRFEQRSSDSRIPVGLRDVIWAGVPLLSPGAELLTYAEGLIPNDATIKLRVNNAYGVKEGTDDANGYPTYRFSIDGKAAADLDEAGVNRALDMINVVPNPYYGFSSYEDTQFETNVKITNLPAKATVTIYSLDGKFIRKYNRDETPTMLRGTNRPVGQRQISPALEWDLKNFRQIPVAGGIYLIHVEAPGLGERTLKWFGVQRQFDPSGL